MTREISYKEELADLLEKAFADMILLLDKFDQKQINTVPFEGNWTASQVADHVTKSNQSITKALLLQGTIINRNPFGRVQELKNIFLDFTTKLNSPDFILPGKEMYDKRVIIGKLAESIDKLKEAGQRVELLEMINHKAFGDITKFEILHFVAYHTQRHTRQLKKILEAVESTK